MFKRSSDYRFLLTLDDIFWSGFCADGNMSNLWIAFEGDMGAGKTTLQISWLNFLNLPANAYPKSVSYEICRRYAIGQQRIVQVDGYRLEHPQEWEILELDKNPGGSETVWIEGGSGHPWLINFCDVVISIEFSKAFPERRYYYIDTLTQVGRAWFETGYQRSLVRDQNKKGTT